jgi:hypothetical protein
MKNILAQGKFIGGSSGGIKNMGNLAKISQLIFLNAWLCGMKIDIEYINSGK